MRRDKSTSAFEYMSILLLCAAATLGSQGTTPTKESNLNASEDIVFGFEGDMMCGPNCLWQIAYAYGKDYSLRELKDMSATDMIKGTTIEGMCEALRQMGLPIQAAKGDIGALRRDRRTAILLVSLGAYDHFVILDKIDGNTVRLLDGDRFVDMSVIGLRSIWKGHMILVGDDQNRARDARLFRYAGMMLQISSGFVLFGAVMVYAMRRIFLRKRDLQR